VSGNPVIIGQKTQCLGCCFIFGPNLHPSIRGPVLCNIICCVT